MNDGLLNDKLLEIRTTFESGQEAAGNNLLRSLLIDLFAEDEFWVLADGASGEEHIGNMEFLPYFSEPDSGFALCLFSSEATAVSYIAEHGCGAIPVRLNTGEFIRFCKAWLMRGFLGYAINQGGQRIWARIPFALTIETFFQLVLEYPDGTAKDYLALLQLSIDLLNHRSVFRAESGELSCGDTGLPVTLDSLPAPTEAIFIRSDYAAGADNLPVSETPGELIESTGERLSTVLTEVEGFFPTQPLSPALSYPFLNAEPALNLMPDDEAAVTETTSLVETRRAKKKKARRKPTLAFLGKLRAETASAINILRRRRVVGILVAVAACLVLFAAVFLVSGLVNYHNYKVLRNNGEHAEAYEVYLKHRNGLFRSRASKYAENDVLLAYNAFLGRDLTYEAAITQMAYNFGAARNLDETAEKAAQVELSRISYAEGLNTDVIPLRLSSWSGVIPEDAENYAAVHDEVYSNEAAYRTDCLALADTLALSGYSAYADWCADVLGYWYPDYASYVVGKEIVPMTESMFSEQAHPIVVAETFTEMVDEHANLYVRWSNVGEKTIREIDFYVYPLDIFGIRMNTTGAIGYSAFQARDIGPYVPGDGTPSMSWAWMNVWDNPRVSGAEIYRIMIFYEDGTMQFLSDPDAWGAM